MNKLVESIVALALLEDVGAGDITTEAVFRGAEQVDAAFIAKEAGILAGVELSGYIFNKVDESVRFVPLIEDGAQIRRGDIIAEVKGNAGSILTAERTCLNFMQRMSGIATKTSRYCKAIADTPAKLLDTRKTMPGQRHLDKWAVRLGGGTNHRFCLDDMYLIKENHIAVAGGIRKALLMCAEHRKQNKLDAKIEIEIETLNDIPIVLESGLADIILLDNMDLIQLSKATLMIGRKVKTEASGNMTLERLPQVARTGVDFISVGGITHSVHALDISLLFE